MVGRYVRQDPLADGAVNPHGEDSIPRPASLRVSSANDPGKGAPSEIEVGSFRQLAVWARFAPDARSLADTRGRSGLAQLFLTGALLHAGQESRRPSWLRRSLDASISALAAAKGARLVDPTRSPSIACFSAAARVQEIELPGEAALLPEAVLVAVVQREPGQLCLRGADGRLLPSVLVVHEPVAGERELRCQLLLRNVRRAVSAYQQALASSEEELAGRLSLLCIHPRLGSMHDKVDRLPGLARSLASALGARGLAKDVWLAARRCKLDLGTELVRDMPELRGLVGESWCLAAGDTEPVARAVASHRRPGDDGEPPPVDAIGALVCVSDRLDTLVAAFAHGLAPTPSEDPLRARSLASGLLRTLLAHDLRVDLRELATLAVRAQAGREPWLSPEDVIIRTTGFLRHRLKVLLGRTFSADAVHGAVSAEPWCPASALALLGSAEPQSI